MLYLANSVAAFFYLSLDDHHDISFQDMFKKPQVCMAKPKIFMEFDNFLKSTSYIFGNSIMEFEYIVRVEAY